MTFETCICGCKKNNFQMKRHDVFLISAQNKIIWWVYVVVDNFITSHYKNTPMQYAAIFEGCKNGNFQMKNCDIFLIFAQNIDCRYTFVLTSTHKLCFRAKIRGKNAYLCKPQFYYIKVGCKGVYITRTCYPDAL